MDYVSMYMNVLFATGTISFFTIIIWIPLALAKASKKIMKSSTKNNNVTKSEDVENYKDSCIKMKDELMQHRNYKKLMKSPVPIDFDAMTDEINNIKSYRDFEIVLNGIVEVRDILNKLDTQTIEEIDEKEKDLV